ncbi:MAG: PAS domain-containing protein [Lewinellaceae bacterium]|nr:PAS domain-containing protein [Lewinellaceae bacterium]
MNKDRIPKEKKSLSKKAPPLQSSVIGKDASIPPSKVQDKSPLLVIGKESVHPFPVVAIGASAGGLEAVTELLKNLSPTTGMAFIYVQHLSPDHKSMLPEILSKLTTMKVQEIDDMEKMRPDNVYVIPFNKEIEVMDGHIQLLPRPKNKSSNLSIDVLFSSLAETHKENVIGIVLSGSASDGTRGLKEIKQAGGITFAQDDSAKFSSMPQSAIAEGVVDFVLSPKEIAAELGWMSEHPLVSRPVVKRTPEDEIDNNNPDLRDILQLIHKSKRVDFSHYKMNTIKRRMLRRMLVHKIKTIKQYAEFLEQKESEVDLLYQDLLINVSDFFRDTEAFALLKTTVLPKLLKNKVPGEPLRIWVAACATGEEAYSIAILLFELQGSKGANFPFQIFASDLSAEALNIARAGEYSANQLKNVSPKRLQQFFTKTKDQYRISKYLRDICVFAEHNILSDPPFSRMDFISCRNFLIYLDTSAQKKAIATFHYALNDTGCLMLGKSETIGTSTALFTTINKKYKVYTRKKNSGVQRIPNIVSRITPAFRPEKSNTATTIYKKVPAPSGVNTSSAFDAALLANYMPASVLINHDLEILQFRGPTSQYLQHAAGKASFNVLKMAHIEIAFELRNAIHHVIKTHQMVRKTGIEMNRDNITNTVQIVNIEVAPLIIEGEEPLLIIVFTAQQVELTEQNGKGGKNNSIAKDRRIKKLEEELAAARADMGTITHDQEVANEELQSANEEVISSNEELQSLNEELETSKEEIESTNEELITTNQELHARIQEIEELYTYYEAILSTVHEPMLILDKNIRIKSANQSFCKTFHVREEDIIGVSLFKLNDNKWNIPQLRELLEDIVPKNNPFHDFEVENVFPVIGHKTLLLNAHRIIQESKHEEFIVLTIADITEVKKLAIEVQLKEKKVLEEAKINAELKAKVAEAALQAKQQFLSNMSHEIRTPMNAIVGFTNVVLKTKLNESQQEYLNAIKLSGDALIVLINDILDLAKVDAGKMTFERGPFDLSASITSILQLFDAKIEEKNLELIKVIDHKIPAVLIGDSIHLRQIILNLLSNAVKFTSAGKITLSVRLLKEDAETVSLDFAVSDTGIGIAESGLEQIFNVFEQVHRNSTDSYGGTGLGLAIVKQLVEPQGGMINVKSELGTGSTFSFVLNFEKTEIKTNKKRNRNRNRNRNSEGISCRRCIVESALN